MTRMGFCCTDVFLCKMKGCEENGGDFHGLTG